MVLNLLDRDYAMLRVSEHSGQVPTRRREIIENQFKEDDEQLNTLVCTPTLGLGVDIGSLGAVLMRRQAQGASMDSNTMGPWHARASFPATAWSPAASSGPPSRPV